MYSRNESSPSLLVCGMLFPTVSFFFDNIFVFSSDWPSHIPALKSVLERIHQHGLTLKTSKCYFGVQEINYLGFVLKPNHLHTTTTAQDNRHHIHDSSYHEEVATEFFGYDIVLQDFHPTGLRTDRASFEPAAQGCPRALPMD